MPPDSVSAGMTAAASDLSTNNEHSLIIEVQLTQKLDPSHREKVRSYIEHWLRSAFLQLKVGQSLDIKPLASELPTCEITIAGHSNLDTFSSDRIHSLADTNLQFLFFTLYSDADDDLSTTGPDENDPPQYTVRRLPHEALKCQWEDLAFQDPIGECMLHAITRIVTWQNDAHLKQSIADWHKNILLHGPPGSGKTSLALALAQKLSIRLSHLYTGARLVQVNAHSLLSRFFGESSKQIGKLFDSILNLAWDDSQLIIVFFDEVESLASSREKAAEANEVADAVRATNELLKGLDRLHRNQSNIVLIATSNLPFNMDPAFLDRFPCQKRIDLPDSDTLHRILCLKVGGYIRAGLITLDSRENGEDITLSSEDQERVSEIVHCSGDVSSTISGNRGRNVSIMGLGERASTAGSPWTGIQLSAGIGTVASELRRIAGLAQGMSPRMLTNLVTYALGYTSGQFCDLKEFLPALDKLVREQVNIAPKDEALSAELGHAEIQQQAEMGDEDMDSHEGDYEWAMADHNIAKIT